MKSKLSIITSMLIFGTIGLITRSVPLPSSALAFLRGVIGVCVILLALKLTKRKVSISSIKANFKVLLFSGALVGANWILLFEAYNHTSIAIATISYYLAPMIVVLLSPLILKEKIGIKKSICMAIALFGMVLVSGVLNESGSGSFVGIAFGATAATCYALVMILNKFLKNIDGIDSTVAQLSFSAITILPYILATEDISSFHFDSKIILLLLLLGVVHTGFAYLLYFSSMLKLESTEVALFSYIDPVSAVILSALVLLEPISTQQIAGVVLVLLATILSDISKKKAPTNEISQISA